jgi:hypothetical protein
LEDGGPGAAVFFGRWILAGAVMLLSFSAAADGLAADTCGATCVRLSDNLPPPPIFLPHSSETPSPPPDAGEFVRRVSNRWCGPIVTGNSIASQFAPDLSGLADLNALAHLGGFDHFNIEQQISEIAEGSYPARLPRWTGVDPALGGNTFAQFNDAFAWYYEEVPAAGQSLPMYDDPGVHVFDAEGRDTALEWRDAPNIGPRNAGVTLTFVDYLVGVYSDHSGVRISQAFADAANVNFQWTLTQGAWGAEPGHRFGRFDQVEPGSEGAITFLGFFGNDADRLTQTTGAACETRATR